MTRADLLQERLDDLRAAAMAVILHGDEPETWERLEALVLTPPCIHGVPEDEDCDDCEEGDRQADPTAAPR